MNVFVDGLGVWIPGASSWAGFTDAVQNGFGADSEWTSPAPALIPPRERRRASLPIKLGVEVASQACATSGIDAASVTSIFTSAMADTAVTDYMCRTLIDTPELVSPTRFHNSVHNAPAGYWSISAGNRQPSSYVGGGEDSFALAMLEAAVTVLTEDAPVLLVALDIATKPPFTDIRRIEHHVAVGMVLSRRSTPASMMGLELSVKSSNSKASRPDHAWLKTLAEDNPIGRSLALLEAISMRRQQTLDLNMGEAATLSATLRVVDKGSVSDVPRGVTAHG